MFHLDDLKHLNDGRYSSQMDSKRGYLQGMSFPLELLQLQKIISIQNRCTTIHQSLEITFQSFNSMHASMGRRMSLWLLNFSPTLPALRSNRMKKEEKNPEKLSVWSTTKSQNKHRLTVGLIRRFFSLRISFIPEFFFLWLYVKRHAKIRAKKRQEKSFECMCALYVHSRALSPPARVALSIKTRNESSTSAISNLTEFCVFPIDASASVLLQLQTKLYTTARHTDEFIFLLSSTSWLSGVSSEKGSRETAKEGIDNVKILIVSHLWKLL